MIQIPSDIFASLLTSICNIRQEVSLLRSDLAESKKGPANPVSPTGSLNFNVQTLPGKSEMASSFTCFPKLPLELRLKLLHLALNEPEVIPIEMGFEKYSGDYYARCLQAKWTTIKTTYPLGQHGSQKKSEKRDKQVQ